MKVEELVETIAESFSISELRDLCFRLNIEYEDLEGENRRDKVIALVLY